MTAAPTTNFSPDLERGLVARADELLGDRHPRQLAEDFALASERLEAAKAHRNVLTTRLDEISVDLPLADAATRKKLLRERMELASEIGFLPAEFQAVAEDFVAKLVAYASDVYHAARANGERLNSDLNPLEVQRSDARNALVNFGPSNAVARQIAQSLGQPAPPATDDAAHERLERCLEERNQDVVDMQAERDAFADLAMDARHSLVSRFGENSVGRNEGVGFEAAGTKRWISALRRRVASQVGRYTGAGEGLKPLGVL